MAAILDLVSVDYLRSTGPIFLWLIGGDWTKVPVDDQHRRFLGDHLGFSIDFLTNACRLVISLQYKLRICLTMTSLILQLEGICHALRCSCPT
jgi:hypothetical protein